MSRRYVAAVPGLRFGDRELEVGEPVPIEEGRGYGRLVRRGHIKEVVGEGAGEPLEFVRVEVGLEQAATLLQVDPARLEAALALLDAAKAEGVDLEEIVRRVGEYMAREPDTDTTESEPDITPDAAAAGGDTPAGAPADASAAAGASTPPTGQPATEATVPADADTPAPGTSGAPSEPDATAAAGTSRRGGRARGQQA